MALSILEQGGVAALGYDSATNERGFLVKFINRTGGVSVKGTLVAPSPTTDREVIKQASEYDTIAVVQEAGVAEASEMWCWVNGSVCQVLLKDTVGAARANVLIAADTDGRVDAVAAPPPPPTSDTHFKEIGHAMETKVGGTNVLVLACIHFN